MNSRESVGSNACAGISPDDCEQLDQAAERLLDARGLIVMISDAFVIPMTGTPVGWLRSVS